VRSALLEVPGVTRAQVHLEAGEVIVDYDPRTATVDAMINALNKADGPLMPRQYKAQVKNSGRSGSPR
jgi:copper chaperone CopZ